METRIKENERRTETEQREEGKDSSATVKTNTNNSTGRVIPSSVNNVPKLLPSKCKCKVGRCRKCDSPCKRCGCDCDGIPPEVALARKPGGSLKGKRKKRIIEETPPLRSKRPRPEKNYNIDEDPTFRIILEMEKETELEAKEKNKERQQLEAKEKNKERQQLEAKEKNKERQQLVAMEYIKKRQQWEAKENIKERQQLEAKEKKKKERQYYRDMMDLFDEPEYVKEYFKASRTLSADLKPKKYKRMVSLASRICQKVVSAVMPGPSQNVLLMDVIELLKKSMKDSPLAKTLVKIEDKYDRAIRTICEVNRKTNKGTIERRICRAILYKGLPKSELQRMMKEYDFTFANGDVKARARDDYQTLSEGKRLEIRTRQTME